MTLAAEPTTITVTHQDIADGRVSFSNPKCHRAISCPINFASRRVFPGKRIRVTADTLVVDAERIDLPEVAVRFIADFDNRRDGEPFSFEVSR